MTAVTSALLAPSVHMQASFFKNVEAARKAPLGSPATAREDGTICLNALAQRSSSFAMQLPPFLPMVALSFYTVLSNPRINISDHNDSLLSKIVRLASHSLFTVCMPVIMMSLCATIAPERTLSQ